ncbi:MAG: hypothetical protein AB8B94_01720 [Hyphomicrobiales bacterium]
MTFDATHGICCEPDPIKFSWRPVFTALLRFAALGMQSPRQNGIMHSLPLMDARAMADIGLGALGNDISDPALRDMTIRHEISKLDKLDRFGR